MQTGGLVGSTRRMASVAALALFACGLDEGSPSGAGGESAVGGTSAGAGASGQGGSGAGASGQGGSSASGGSGGGTSSGGTGGSATAECSGVFGEPALLFSGGANTDSLSVTADELEIYYVDGGVFVRRRATRGEPFGDPMSLPQISSACPGDDTEVTLDVSEDGLRLYFVCSDPAFQGNFLDELHQATRPNRSSDFQVVDDRDGRLNAFFGLSADELRAYSFVVSSNAPPGNLEMWRRPSTSDPFDRSEPVPGISEDFRQPDPTRDELGLYGYLIPDFRLAVATRASTSESFSPPRSDGLPVPPTDLFDSSPAISADCRTLYFTRMPAAPRTAVDVYAARR